MCVGEVMKWRTTCRSILPGSLWLATRSDIRSWCHRLFLLPQQRWKIPFQNVEPRRTSTLQDRVVYDARPVPLPIRQERPDEGVTFSTGMMLSPGIPSQAPQAHSTFDSDLEESVRYVPPPPAVLPPGIPRAPGERKFPGAVPVFGMLHSNDAAAARYQPPANDNRFYANSVTQYDSEYQVGNLRILIRGVINIRLQPRLIVPKFLEGNSNFSWYLFVRLNLKLKASF